MKRFWLIAGLGCVACCLPLIVPLMGAAGLAGFGGWASGLSLPEVACLAGIVAVTVVGITFLLRRKRTATGPSCDVRD